MRISSELIKGGDPRRNGWVKYSRAIWGSRSNSKINNAEHVVMDFEHGHLLMRVARKHALRETAQNQVITGAMESLLIDRLYRNYLADMVEVLP